MLDIGFQELLVILVIALIVLGPKKLPEIARRLGRAMAELRRTSEALRRSILAEQDYRETPRFSDTQPTHWRKKLDPGASRRPEIETPAVEAAPEATPPSEERNT